MGLVKLAAIGGVGYYAFRKLNKDRDQTQNPQQSHQKPSQQHRDNLYQPDYYNYNGLRSPEDEMYNAPSERPRSYNSDASQRLPHEKPLQMNFVDPSEKTMRMMMPER